MLSLIEVKCPHCGAQGQIIMPPMGAIIVGPCPECEGMVVVFCGLVLALDKEIMTTGSIESKQDHLLDVLGTFLQERIRRLFGNALAEEAEPQSPESEQDAEADAADELPGPQPFALGGGGMHLTDGVPLDMISDEEFSRFVSTDLKLIDNPKYFKAVFD